ncbi:MAG: thioredoxin domain-containing protein [Planctomycetaceae bacterium]
MSTHFSRIFVGVCLAAVVVMCPGSEAAEIPWSTDIEQSLQHAAANNQLVLMEFTADWCVFCKKMEKNTFTNANVAQRISRNFVAVRVDADQNKELVKDLGIKGLPAILVVSPDLKVVERISGFQTAEALIPKLDAITAAHASQIRPPAMARTQHAPQRPVNNPVQQKPFEPQPMAPSRPIPGELQFEAITQEEAPRVGAPRAAAPSRNPVFETPEFAQPEPAVTRTSNPDAESFFKTISRKQEQRHAAPVSAAPSFGGLCIVSAVDNRELVKGNSGNQLNYKGRTLYFSSIEHKERFQASPANYWPMLDGACAMTLLQDERQVEGSLEFAAVYRKRIWLFVSQNAMQEFLRHPADAAEEAVELVAELNR